MGVFHSTLQPSEQKLTPSLESMKSKLLAKLSGSRMKKERKESGVTVRMLQSTKTEAGT